MKPQDTLDGFFVGVASYQLRGGFLIGFCLSNSVEFRTKAPPIDRGVDGGDFGPVSSTDDLLTRYEEYGSTPPRTRIKIKNRDWERKQRM